jgi:hypothetical protein
MPECGSECWRNEVHNGVSIVHDEWKCDYCGWDEDQAFPMDKVDWCKYLKEGEESLK